MKANVGSTDRLLRLIAGVIILALGVYYQSFWGVLGLVLILTGVMRFCGLYALLGKNTCPR